MHLSVAYKTGPGFGERWISNSWWRSVLSARPEFTFSQCPYNPTRPPQSYTCNLSSKCDLRKNNSLIQHASHWLPWHSMGEKKKSHYFLLTKRFLRSSCDICWRPHLWSLKKKYRKSKSKRGEKQKELSSEASHPDQAWLDCVFFLPQQLPGWRFTVRADLPQFPTVNLNGSPLSHLLPHSHPLLCRCAHLFILNPVIIVPLHWPAGKALLKLES